MADRLYTSNDADEVLSALRFETKLEKATLARIAFALSLVKEGPRVAQSGGKMKCPTFVGEIDRISSRTMLIDVHAMPVLKELVAYLVIERLYKEMALLPDSPVKEGRRTIRTILVIDEAHNYLSQKNIFLQRIIREGRSKGIVVFFASQSPNDYQQKFFNFQELLEFAFIFQCEGVAAASVQDILGCSAKTARDLQTEIARLEPWQVISRSPEKTEEFVKFTAEAFYRCYA